MLRFKVLEKIGEGTYGVVYCARDSAIQHNVQGKHVEDESLVALKKMRLDAYDEGVPVTTLREVALLKDLCHENIVRYAQLSASPGLEVYTCSAESTPLASARMLLCLQQTCSTHHAVRVGRLREVIPQPPRLYLVFDYVSIAH